jgi:hypothetical protein
VNLTKIKFTNEEMALLNKGLQYSIEKPIEKYWTDLVMKTEQAIRNLNVKMQAPFRILATKKLKQINASAKRLSYILKTITSKLKNENAIVVKADKGKTSVIIYTDDYNKKVHDFLDNNNFQKLQKDPTNKYQKLITTNLQHCDLIIHKNQMKHLTQRKPQPPLLKAQIKIHKPGNPIRHVVNNLTAPAYKIAKFLAKKLNDYTHLKYQYNVKDSTTLANDLRKLELNDNHRMINFDIKDLYVNIPINETLMITKTLISNHNNEQVTKQILTLLKTILQQNYLSFQYNIYQPPKGVSMGSPISGIVSEIFLQHLENTQLKQILDTNNITLYIRYVDDILIIYDTKKVSPEIIQDHINNIQPAMKFSPSHEHNNTINFLDLSIIRYPSKIEIDIYRKPTTTDTTINHTPNHPTEHKMAAYRYIINKMLMLPLTAERKK